MLGPGPGWIPGVPIPHSREAIGPSLRSVVKATGAPPDDGSGVVKLEKHMGLPNSLWRARVLLTVLALVTWPPLPLNGQSGPPGLDTGPRFSGDFRFRFEETDGDDPGNPLLDSRQRLTLRFRAGIMKRMNEYLSFGARMVTGDPGDPNTADVTLGDFVDDLAVSLDRAYLQLHLGSLSATGGKIPNPFMRTDLVWDGDVNPEGISAGFTFPTAGGITPRLTAILRVIDEQARKDIKDSGMVGAQGEITMEPARDIRLRLAGSYYDYDINSLVDADAGDTRSNYLTEDEALGAAPGSAYEVGVFHPG